VVAVGLAIIYYWQQLVINNTSLPTPVTKLSIALVVLECHRYGGQDQYVFELAEQFAAAGHEVHLYCHVLRGQFAGSIRVHHVPVIGGLMLLRFISFFIVASWQLWRATTRYDIVHAAGGNFWGANVVTAHYCHPRAHQVARHTATNLLTKLSVWRQLYDYVTFIVADWLDQLVYQKRPDTTIIAVSEATKTDLITAYHLPVSQLEVVYNGVNLTRFSSCLQATWRSDIRTKYQINDDTPMLLFVGTFARKGLGVLLNALAQLPVSNPAKLWVVGSGPQPFWQQLADHLQVADRVIWIGSTTTVEEFYAAADIFVLPTFYEPFGLVIAEAMASGLPVITSRRAGAAELITHQNEGWLLDDPQDSAALATAIETLLLDLTTTRLMGQRARQIIANYGWPAVAARTLSIYHKQLTAQKTLPH
jgi:UDP-glucose:(heptosyl)LPS alpha-1,3-glucosyltransferase